MSAPISGGKYPRLSLRWQNPCPSVSWEKLVGASAAIVVLFLIAVPLSMLLFSSVRSTESTLPFEATEFTLANYGKMLTSEVTYRLFLNTLWYALGALVVSVGLAMLFAWFLERGRTPLRPLLVMLVLAPMATPPLVGAMGWAQLANPSTGPINTLLRSIFGMAGQGPLNIYSIPGMVLVTGFHLVPAAYIMLSGPIGRLDPSLEEAGFTSGVSPLTIFRRITFPLLRPAVLATVLYFFVLVLEIFEVAALLGMPHGIFVFSTLIFDAVHPPRGLPNYGMASTYAIVALVISGVLIYLYGLAIRRKEAFAVVTGKGYRPKLIEYGLWKYAFIALIVVVFALAVLMPLSMLVWTSLGLAYKTVEISSLAFASLNEYRELIQAPTTVRAVTNTAIVATVAATTTMVLASVISWMSTRSNLRWAALPDRLTILVVATPNIVIALALAFFYLWVPLPIYATIWIIVIAMTTRYLAYTTRLMGAAYLQIHKDLEEASQVSGVTWPLTMRHIVLPLVWPSFARGWLLVFVYAMRDTTLALMLFSVTNDLIGVRLWTIWFSDVNFPKASALAVCLAVASMALSFLIAKWTGVQQEQI